MPFSKANRSHTLNGIVFVALFAFASSYVAEFSGLARAGISSLVIAIVLGMFYGNTLRHRLPTEWVPGIQFSAKQVLRLAIILYGFRVSLQEIVEVGMEGFLLDCFIVGSTLFIGYLIGTKLLKLDHHLALLISAGAAICGAAAVLAVEDVLKSKPFQTTVAVGTVVLFGTLGMFLLPLLHQTGFSHLTNAQFGLWTGASIHEVAQVVVAGTQVSTETGNIAVIVKMTRVLLLVPCLFLLIFLKQRQSPEKSPWVIPWFAIFFLVTIGFNSIVHLPETLIKGINQFDTFLLTMAMAAIGIETQFAKIKHVGLKPLYLAILLFGWLLGSSWIVIKGV